MSLPLLTCSMCCFRLLHPLFAIRLEGVCRKKGQATGLAVRQVRQATCLDHISAEMKTCRERNHEVSELERY